MSLDTGLIFVKFGGSLITDKTRPETTRHEIITRLAREVRQGLDSRPDLLLLLGHGSGSFGHWHASQHGTRDGVRGARAWLGYAQVAASAARLNHIVMDALLAAGVPVLAIRPSSSARCRDGVLIYLNTDPIRRALEEGLVPLVHGDVALDEVRGGTIVSTEELMVYLTDLLHPAHILLFGETDGVRQAPHAQDELESPIISCITPDDVDAVADSLGRARGRDVTGGMTSKVLQMLALVQTHPGLRVHILSGLENGLVSRALLDPNLPAGTCIVAP